MNDMINEEKEMLNILNEKLYIIHDFLMGPLPAKDCEEQKDNCLTDVMKKNLKSIDNAIVLTDIIKDTIMGGIK